MAGIARHAITPATPGPVSAPGREAGIAYPYAPKPKNQ